MPAHYGILDSAPMPGRDGLQIVTYTATGIEGTSFMVPLPEARADASYSVVWAPQGVTNVPLLDLPQNPGDRTTTAFRVLTAEQLAAGEKLHFWVMDT